MREADYLVDIGPFAGERGGTLVACGTLKEIEDNPNSITGKYLSGKLKVEVPAVRRKGTGEFISIKGARENNLKNIDVDFPLGVFTCVTGVSGSGKSSLITDILYPALSNRLNGSTMAEGRYDSISGLQNVDKVIAIDQSPIGRTPRSNPATYTGVFTQIRELFASTPDAKERGYLPGRFSFNVSGGRCEACCGDGIKKIEMYFLPDVYVPCEVCKGRRYNRETLEVKYKGKSIYDVLEMTVEDALTFFENQSQIKSKIQALYDVGLGYIKLGQAATTLSGGEDVTFGYPWTSNPSPMYRPFWRSGGGLLEDYEGSYYGEWVVDTAELPEKYRKYAPEIDCVFNENVEYGCCGGCI